MFYSQGFPQVQTRVEAVEMRLHLKKKTLLIFQCIKNIATTTKDVYICPDLKCVTKTQINPSACGFLSLQFGDKVASVASQK